MLLLWATDEQLSALLLSSAAFLSLIYVSLFLHKPQKIRSSSESWSGLFYPLQYLKNRAMAWIFLVRGPQIIRAAYKQSNGSPFSVDVPENRYWIVSKWEHIREIDAAPEGVLSLQGAAKEILQPRHTMEEFNWNDKKGSDGAPLLKTLRTMLTGHLPELLPDIRDMMSALLDEHRDRGQRLNGGIATPLYPMVIGSIAQSNAFAFFGKDLAHDKIFMKAGMDMIEQTLIIAEIVRVLPSFLANPTGKLLASYMNSSKTVFNTLEPLVTLRFEERERAKRGQKVPEHKDCVQWVMENSPKTKPWSVKRVVHELIALWFGSVHITSTTACFVLFDLCSHPEYIEPLRQEFEATGWEALQKSGGKLLPLMDSFMKESARLTPVESVSTRRKALKPFHFSDGTRVEAGEWVCSAPRSMNVDSTYYSEPTQFHGFRFVRPEVLDKASKTFSGSFAIPEGQEPSEFTELSDWQLWGTGKSSCTGRWYASSAIKTMLALFITKWDIALEDPNASRYFAWRTFIYPYSNVKAILKERA